MFRFTRNTEGTDGRDLIIGSEGDDRIQGGLGFDVLYGGRGADVFVFERGDSAPIFGGVGDWVFDFQPGVDKLDLGTSPREVTWTAVPGGVQVTYGELAGQGVDAGVVFLRGVASLGVDDFLF